MGDVLIEDEYKDLIRIIPVSNIEEVLEHSLVGVEKDGLIAILKNSLHEQNSLSQSLKQSK